MLLEPFFGRKKRGTKDLVAVLAANSRSLYVCPPAWLANADLPIAAKFISYLLQSLQPT